MQILEGNRAQSEEISSSLPAAGGLSFGSSAISDVPERLCICAHTRAVSNVMDTIYLYSWLPLNRPEEGPIWLAIPIDSSCKL